MHFHVFRKKQKPFGFKSFKKENEKISPEKKINHLESILDHRPKRVNLNPNSRTFNNEHYFDAQNPKKNTYLQHVSLLIY